MTHVNPRVPLITFAPATGIDFCLRLAIYNTQSKKGIAMVLEIISIGLAILVAAGIVVYATFLLLKRLRKGDPKLNSFGDWIKHIVEAVMGL
jgi:ABC-type nickel/cobalt efflux system permease component RcnA